MTQTQIKIAIMIKSTKAITLKMLLFASTNCGDDKSIEKVELYCKYLFLANIKI
jgi:hypothetical protein